MYPAAQTAGRAAILLGGLALGEAAEQELRERLTSRDTAEKLRLALGLGEMGHPLSEGHLARILRERPSVEVAAQAVRGLGRTRGTRTLPVILQALTDPFLFPAGCESLARYGGGEAVSALLARASELPALRALADLGAPEATELFLSALEQEEEWQIEAVRGIGNLADPGLGAVVLPFLSSPSGSDRLVRAGFEAYARLGAPAGADALLAAASRGLRPWMIEALGWVQVPEVHRFLLGLLEPRGPRGLLDRLLRRRRRVLDDARPIYRAIRGSFSPDVRNELARRLRTEADPLCVREILSQPDLISSEEPAGVVLGIWREGPLLATYLAARLLLSRPGKTFLCDVLDSLARPSFMPLDRVPWVADPERLLEAYCRDNNPFLLVGGFLDSGLVNLDELEQSFRIRFARGAFPSSAPPKARFTRPEELSVGVFLSGFADAYPGKADCLARIWDLLDRSEDRATPLLDFFLSWTGDHRGGLQRELARGLAAGLTKCVEGKTDAFLPELEEIAAHVPAEGPLTRQLKEAFDAPRRALMAEARDLVLMAEGSARGDIVLVEKI